MAAFKGGSVLSSTLQEITDTKLHELSKRRNEYENRRARVIAALAEEQHPIRRLQILSKGVKQCFGIAIDDDEDDGTDRDRPDNTATPNTDVGAIADYYSSGLSTQLDNLDLFISQARYDPSISPAMARKREADLFKHLDMRSLKFEYASLYAQLVTEWLASDKATSSGDSRTGNGNDQGEPIGMGGDGDAEDDFEDLALAAKKGSRAEFEHQVFTVADVDEAALQQYLTDIFGVANPSDPAHEGHNDALKTLREQVKAIEQMLATPGQFNRNVLTWVSDGLIASGSLSDEKRQVLQDFKNQPIIMDEVADVLNMRMQSLEAWTWGPQGVGLNQERQINGVYNIVMQEDLLQALLLYFIGVKLSVGVKQALRAFRKTRDSAWVSSSRKVEPRERARRKYYIGQERNRDSAQALRDRVYRKHYFVSALKSSEFERLQAAPAEVEAQYYGDVPVNSSRSLAMPSVAPRRIKMRMSAQKAMVGGPMDRSVVHNDAPSDSESEDDFIPDTDNESDVEQDDGADPSSEKTRNRKSLSVIKQRLLRLLSTEMIINTKLHGEVTAMRSSFESWDQTLPHQTIIGVLSFLGFSHKWLGFFGRFLAAPLRFGDDGPNAALRDRKRGTPESRVLSDLFGETTLFCLDLAVNRVTSGAHLWRLQDEFWFWSRDLAAVEKMWEAMKRFEKTTVTNISIRKSGSVRVDLNGAKPSSATLPQGEIRWGLLRLSPSTGEFEIDQKLVDRQILDLRKQLYSKRGSIIAFLQSWNAYASTFFTHNFGKPANCFGRKHVEAILVTHNRVQREVFVPQAPPLVSLTSHSGFGPNGHSATTSMAEFLKSELLQRFGVSDVPDAFLFFPTDMGGLDLSSPFIEVLQVHKTVLADPAARLDEFLDDERRAYRTLEKAWAGSGHGQYEMKSSDAAAKVSTNNAPAESNFITFADFTQYREYLSPSKATNNRTGFHGLGEVYRELLRLPSKGGVNNVSPAVTGAIESLSSSGGSGERNDGITNSLATMKPYWKWIVAVYGDEVVNRFGGLRIVEPGLLPMGMVRMFKDRKVNWEA